MKVLGTQPAVLVELTDCFYNPKDGGATGCLVGREKLCNILLNWAKSGQPVRAVADQRGIPNSHDWRVGWRGWCTPAPRAQGTLQIRERLLGTNLPRVKAN